jgi:hypothetical protein
MSKIKHDAIRAYYHTLFSVPCYQTQDSASKFITPYTCISLWREGVVQRDSPDVLRVASEGNISVARNGADVLPASLPDCQVRCRRPRQRLPSRLLKNYSSSTGQS